GSARFDFFKPLLMTVEDILRFIKDSPGKVIANHMEAVNHCPTTRNDLANLVAKENLDHKTYIPEDGEVMAFH
ncbi:MAG: MBL fold metallo-hydrolase, partial [Bacteroidota bacterium]